MIKVILDELKSIFNDHGAFLIMVGGFFLYGLFYMTPFCHDVLKEVPIAVIDMDNSKFSRELIRNFDASENISVKYELPSLNEAKELYHKGKIYSYVLIPKDFQKNILNGKFSTITSFEDSAYLIIYKQVASGVLTSAISYSSMLEAGSFVKLGVPIDVAFALKVPFDFVQMPLYNPISSYQNYVYPLVAILIMQQTAFAGIGMLIGTIKEKILGYNVVKKGKVVKVFENPLRQFDVNAPSIVLGKALAHFCIYFIYSIICIYIFPSIVNYKMSFNPASLLFTIPFVFAVSFMAQCFICIFNKREDVMFFFIPMSLPLIFLTGFIWPREAIPYILSILSYLVPSTSAIDALVRINQMGGNFHMVIKDFVILIFLCVFYFTFATYFTNKYKNIEV